MKSYAKHFRTHPDCCCVNKLHLPLRLYNHLTLTCKLPPTTHSHTQPLQAGHGSGFRHSGLQQRREVQGPVRAQRQARPRRLRVQQRRQVLWAVVSRHAPGEIGGVCQIEYKIASRGMHISSYDRYIFYITVDKSLNSLLFHKCIITLTITTGPRHFYLSQ